jgi:tetraacyldisaccharide 4'-kinase
LNQESYRKIISGENDGLYGRFMRSLLGSASVPYSWIINRRNRLYDTGKFRGTRAPVPVISIGNITAGGTGKTPLVIWLCNYLLEKDLKTAILTRGYGSNSQLRDEPAVFAAQCPAARVIIDADRVRGAVKAVNEENANILVMDDGFQHRRLARDLDIIVMDATCPFGYDKLLPAGLLRELPQSLRRAHAVVLTRCDLVSPRQLEDIVSTLRDINPCLIMARSIHKPLYAQTYDGYRISIEQLKNKKVAAFCGIGNPKSFFAQLKDIGCDVLAENAYNDHHNYTKSDIEDITEEAIYLDADLVLTTQKDWVKISAMAGDFGANFAFIAMALEFLSGKDKIVALIDSTLSQKKPSLKNRNNVR